VRDNIKIRAALDTDASTFAALSAFVQDLHFRERPDVFKETDVLGLERWFQNTLSTASAQIWIAEIGDVPTGYIVVTPQSRDESVFCYQRCWHEVDNIGVHPKYRKRGVARALLNHVVRIAAAKGVPEIELNTWSFNQLAHRSFEHVGFLRKNLRFARRVERT